ncbi:hypothetical protein L2E82_51265 [Cichorium intybus]|nr:hypothetical protein L2E82_51265 [Cichorium intybus]
MPCSSLLSRLDDFPLITNNGSILQYCCKFIPDYFRSHSSFGFNSWFIQYSIKPTNLTTTCGDTLSALSYKITKIYYNSYIMKYVYKVIPLNRKDN